MANYFTKIATAASAAGVTPNQTQEARDWFRESASQLTSRNVKPVRLMNDKQNIRNNITIKDIGKMFMFFYDPKLKDSLPYYDIFPLVFPIGFKNNGFLGINMHYLPPTLRAQLMNSLYLTINNEKFDDTTKLRISYEILSSSSRFKYFAPCVKHYLWDHVQGNKYLYVEPKNWDSALMLPLQRFKKEMSGIVYKDSKSRVS